MPSTAFGVPQTTAWIVLIYLVAIVAAAVALGAFIAIVVTALPRIPKLQGLTGEPETASVPYAGRITGCRPSGVEPIAECRSSSAVATFSTPAVKGFARRHVVAGPWGKR